MAGLRDLINKYKGRYLSKIRDAVKKDEGVAQVLMHEYKKWLCRNDLFFLTCLCGYNNIAKWGKFYRPICDEVSLMNWKVVGDGIHVASEDMIRVEEIRDDQAMVMQRLYLGYRTIYKTTVVTICHSLQLLLNFPNIHIVLCHNKENTSSANLMTIKNLFLSEPELDEGTLRILREEYGIYYPTSVGKLFSECVPKTKEWGNMGEFSLANRTDKNRPEHNIMAVGVDTEITGGHWDIAKKNDLVTEKSVNTEEQIKKTIDWDDRFNEGHFTDVTKPLQDYEGTRYHFSDMYSVRKGDTRIKLIEVPIVKDLDKFLETGEGITHEERFTYEDIKALMGNMWVFNCQMMLKPEDPSRMQFKKEMIKYFNSVPNGSRYCLLIDPASSRKKKSDYTVMLVVGVIRVNGVVRKYIVDGIRDKLDPYQRVREAFDLCSKWSIKGRSIGWEAISFQDTDCYNFEEERRRRGYSVSIEEIKAHSVSKEDRVKGLIPEYAKGEWFWPEKGKCERMSKFNGRNYDLTVDMEYEMLHFPLAEHDDLMDAQTFLNRLEIVAPDLVEEDNEPQPMTFGDYHKMMGNKENQDPWDELHIGSYV